MSEPTTEVDAMASGPPADEEEPLLTTTTQSYDIYDPSVSELYVNYAENQIHKEFARAYASSGFPQNSYNNLHYIESSVLLSFRGNSVVLYNTITKDTKILQGAGKGSIGAIAVHPSGKYFAVGEKSEKPNILVYEYPSLNICKILRKGTERAYSDMVFDASGERLASVGSAPDFLLTVWNWKTEQIQLHAKAFAQDVFRVQFSPVTEGRLITSGTGHIRFWKMADTFTGLKLQGDIGKFGNVDLSDICSFVELSNGKVVSGAESGYLHLWDGHFIQFVVSGADKKPPHRGMVTYVDNRNNQMVTAGVDGYIRLWDASGIEFAEVDEDNYFEMPLVQEIFLGEGVVIRSVLRGEDHWLVHDQSGAIWRVDILSHQIDKWFSFHSGGIMSSFIVPQSSVGITAGEDGTVRAWDCVTGQTSYMRRFASAVTCVLPLPNTTYALAAFRDGTLRVLQRCQDGFRLHQVLKPHTKSIVSVELSPDQKTIATVGQDNTLFFLGVRGTGSEPTLAPLGFVDTPSRPRKAVFAQDNLSVLLVCAEATYSLSLSNNTVPTEDYDRETYKLDAAFVPLTIHVVHLEEEKVDPVEAEAAKEKAKEEEGEKGDKENPEEDNGDAVQEADNAPKMIEVKYQPRVSTILRKIGGTGYYVCFEDASEASLLYEFDSIPDPSAASEENNNNATLELVATEVLPLHLTGSASQYICFLDYDAAGKHLLLGSTTGYVQVRAVDQLAVFLQSNMHDFRNGHITGASLSADGTCLCTTGVDGNVVFESVNLSLGRDYVGPEPDVRDVAEIAAQSELLLTSSDATVAGPVATVGSDVSDITQASAYSIEEARQKQELDDQIAAAEAKKKQVRAQIAQLRKEFSALLQENHALPSEEQLPRESFELDPELRQKLEAEAEKQVEQVQKEMAYETQKSELQLKKLKARFLDDILVERISMSAFRTAFNVCSFRVVELPQWLQEAIQDVHKAIDEETKAGMAGLYYPEKAEGGEAGQSSLVIHGGVSGRVTGEGVVDAGSSSALSKREEDNTRHDSLVSRERPTTESDYRKRQKEERMEKRRQLEEAKPDDNIKDLNQAPEIKEAIKNMGDYKLKSDPNYVVPETKRVNAEKKRRQMILLQESVHFIKMGFNERFLALRETKKRICENVKADNERIRKINEEIGQYDELYDPVMSDSEWPEKRFEYSDADLETFAKEREEAAKKKKGGMFGMQSEGSGQQSSSTSQAGDASRSASKNDNKAGGVESKKLSPLEQAEKRRRVKKLEYEKKVLLSKIEQTITSFDESIYEMRREKYRLDSDLKAADLKLLVLYQELELLVGFEPEEKKLFERFSKCQQQKASLVSAMSKCESELANRLEEIKSWQEKDRLLVAEFNTAVGGPKSEFYTQLLKIFKKKVRRHRKRGEDLDGDEDSENGDDSASNYSEEEDSSDDEDEDVCPIGCDSSMYETVLELREKRLEQEEILSEFNASVTELNKRYQQHQVKEKSIDKELAATEQHIQDLQSEKQKALNQIPVAFPLKLSQVQYLENGRLPESVDQALIFTSTGMERLRNRIYELQEEKVTLKHKARELKKKHKALLKSLKQKQDEIEAEKKKCQDVQILKFGQVIDLNVLEKVGADSEADELREKLGDLEAMSLKKIQTWERKIKNLKEKLAYVTQQNTVWLERVAMLTKAQYDLEDELNSTTKGMHIAGTDNADEVNKEEKLRLLELVQRQEDELDSLKSEIHVLRRKGGQVYAP